LVPAAHDDSLIFDSRFLAKLERLYLLSRKIFRGHQHGERKSRQTGSSLEFADYRNYTPGDDLRMIDWNIYGRLDRLFVKLFEQEQDLPVYFLIDASASMRWSPGPEALTKFDQARRVAASLAYIALANLDRVNMFYFSGELGAASGMCRGKGQFHTLLQFVKYPPVLSGATRLLQSARKFSQEAKRRGVVFVLSDFFDPAGYEEALRLLRFHQFDAQVVHVLDPGDLDPSVRGDLQLFDAESDSFLELTADDSLLHEYRSAVETFTSDLRNFCVTQRFGHVTASTEIGFEDLVLRVLRRGAIVR
jgi:uncharacterized protein (DUF58 family)